MLLLREPGGDTMRFAISRRTLCSLLATTCFWLGASLKTQASDAMLLEQAIDIQTGLDLANFPTKTLYRSKKDKDQFYYLPANMRFALDKDDQPMLTVYKYNLVYNNGNFADLKENTALGEVYQGGTLKATLTMGLKQNELQILEDALKAKGISQSPKVGRLPLNKASFTVTLTDPEKEGSQMLLGPFPAPVSADIIAIQQPLTKSATDIFYTILTGKKPKLDANGDPELDSNGDPVMQPVKVPDFPMNVLLTFEYGGYGLDGTVEVIGKWDNVYKSTSEKMEAEVNYWFISAKASYEDTKSELLQNANIEIKYDGEVPPELKKDYDGRVMDKILEQAFDLGGLEPAAEDALDPNAAKVASPSGQELFGKPAGAAIGYAKKAVSRGRKGDIRIKTTLLNRITKDDARYAVLDMTNVTEDNVMVIEPSDWSVARVQAEISEDAAPWFVTFNKDGARNAQLVNLTYGTPVSRQTFPKQILPGSGVQDFGPFPNGGDPKVEVAWNLSYAPLPEIVALFGIDPKIDVDGRMVDNPSYLSVSGAYPKVTTALTKYYSFRGPEASTESGSVADKSGSGTKSGAASKSASSSKSGSSSKSSAASKSTASKSSSSNKSAGTTPAQSGPVFNMKGDLRLMSGITLSAAAFPLKPDRLYLQPMFLGPDEGFNWDSPGNVITLKVEQEYTMPDGKKDKISYSLGRVTMKDGSPVVSPAEPLQAIILQGSAAGSAKLIAENLVLSRDNGQRVTKSNVVLISELESGSPVIVLDNLIK